MIWLDVISLGILLLLLAVTVANLFVFRRVHGKSGDPVGDDMEAGGNAPLISVLVPARNEELRIEECLRSLLAQGYDNYEVIVLDDNSADATAAVVERLGFSRDDGAIHRLVSGKPLPEGWKGKPWACHQLAKLARGEFLLFTDADTKHSPAMLNAVSKFAARTRSDLLSLWPRQQTKTWAEQLVVPLMYVLVLALLPQYLLVLLQRFPRVARHVPLARLQALGAANGQFMLFRAEAYRAIGGHESVRDHLVEDVALARLMAARTGEGLRLINADGCEVVSCRMYVSFWDVWEGFSKNLRPAFDATAPFVFFGAVQFLAFVYPFVRLALGGMETILAVTMVAIVYLIRAILTWRFGTSWLGCVLHPVGYGLALVIALNSWRLTTLGLVRWKGRIYGE
jgi:chlorobactene glucosyltransferase